jgi:hypothetical protein
MVFYTEQRVRKQLLDDPLHLHAKVIRQQFHGPGLHGLLSVRDTVTLCIPNLSAISV